MDATVEKVHAELSPSGADRWMTCLGSTALCKGLPNTSNKYSDEGTDYHTLAAICMEEEREPEEFIGGQLPLGTIVTEENARFLREGYLDYLRAYAVDGKVVVEQAVPLTWYTLNPDDEGTSDAIVMRRDRELVVDDLKFGMGVDVEVDDNRQCKIYALSYIKAQQLEEDYDTIRLVISQPRTGDGKPKEWTTSMADLLKFGDEVIRVAAKIMDAEKKGIELPLVPSEKACRFCKAKATCPALKAFVDGRMSEGFEDVPDAGTLSQVGGLSLSRAEVLGRAMDGIDLIEIYMKGVQSAVEIELLAGKPVVGIDGPYKLVQGKKGNRKWINEEEATKLFLTFRLAQEDMYNMKLISPTDAEKLLKKEHPVQWKKVIKMYEQPEGSKHVANAKDARPALVMAPMDEGFENVEDAEEFF